MMLSIIFAMMSCCVNVVLLEILIKEVPGCGNLITFFQFLFIACEGFIFTCKFGTVKPAIPIKNYILLVIMFFGVSVSNNCALNYDVPMPLHMIFKSGSLVASMLLGMLILRKRYSIIKYISVLIVSIGIFIATWASQQLKVNRNDLTNTGSSFKDETIIGITLLSFSLLLSAGLGIYQERIFIKHGKHPKEALFYSHALPLPGFIILANDISSLVPIFSKSAAIQVLPMINIPKLWVCLIGNVMTQYVCVRSVFTIASTYSSLTLTMIVTCRKFLSLIFSIVYFQNPFTPAHWVGSLLVFAGTLLYSDIGSYFEQKEKKVM